MWPRTAFLLSYKDTSRKEIDGETLPRKEIDGETLPRKEIDGETPKEIDSEIFKNLPAEMRPKLIAAVPESHKK